MTPFKFVLIKDPHFMFGFKNRIRKSGWEADIDSKIDQIISFCLTNEITYVLFTGDVSEKSRKRDWSLNQLIQNKKRLRRFKNAGLSIISNMGNHDYFDGHEAITDTAFGDYVESGLITYVGSGTLPLYFDIDKNVQLELSGIDHHNEEEEILDKLQIIKNTFRPGYKLIKMTTMHSNITSKPEQLTDFTYDQLSQYNIDVINCGHYHLQSADGAVSKVQNTYFLNPWNLTRVARDYHVKLDDHIPEFVSGEIGYQDGQATFNFRTIQLNVKPFSEAFNVEAINILQELGKTKFDFFKTIDLKEDAGDADDGSIISELAKEHKISKEAINIAKGLLE